MLSRAKVMMMSSQWQWWWPFLCLMDPSVEQIEQWPNQRGQWSDPRFLSSTFLDFDESLRSHLLTFLLDFDEQRIVETKKIIFSPEIAKPNMLWKQVSILSSKISTHPGRLDIVEKAKVSNEYIEINWPDWKYLCAKKARHFVNSLYSLCEV